jgi:hypothetical protein
MPILVTLTMEAILFSETSVLKRATWRNIPEESIPQETLNSVTTCKSGVIRNKSVKGFVKITT